MLSLILVRITGINGDRSGFPDERKKDAEKDLPKIISKLENGYTEPVKMTMEDYFEQWLDRKKNTVSYGTFEHYESYMRKHIIPGLGKLQVSKLESHHMESFMDEVNDTELSQRSKKHTYRILSSALLKGKGMVFKKVLWMMLNFPKWINKKSNTGPNTKCRNLWLI